MHGWGRIGKGLQAFAGVFVVLDIIGATELRRIGGSLTNAYTFDKAKKFGLAGLQIFIDVFVRQLGPWMFRLAQIRSCLGRLIYALRVYITGDMRERQRIERLFISLSRSGKVMVFSRKGRRAKKLWRERKVPFAVRAEAFEDKYLLPVAAIGATLVAGMIFYLQYDQDFPQGIVNAVITVVLSFLIVGILFGILFATVRVLGALGILLLAGLAVLVDALLIEPFAWLIGHAKNESLIKLISLFIFGVGFYFDLLAS